MEISPELIVTDSGLADFDKLLNASQISDDIDGCLDGSLFASETLDGVNLGNIDIPLATAALLMGQARSAALAKAFIFDLDGLVLAEDANERLGGGLARGGRDDLDVDFASGCAVNGPGLVSSS